MLLKNSPVSFFSRVKNALAIILLCVAGAIVYGITNDAITSNIDLTYFTEGFHKSMMNRAYQSCLDLESEAGSWTKPIYTMLCKLYSRILQSDSKLDHTIFWGIAATWWVGLGLGIILALCTQIGRNPIMFNKLIAPLAVLIFFILASSLSLGALDWRSSLKNPSTTDDEQMLQLFGERYLLCAKIHFYGYLNGFSMGLVFCLLCVFYRFGVFDKYKVYQQAQPKLQLNNTLG